MKEQDGVTFGWFLGTVLLVIAWVLAGQAGNRHSQGEEVAKLVENYGR